MVKPVFVSPYTHLKINGFLDNDRNVEYLDTDLYDLAFYNKEEDGEPIFVDAKEIYIDNNDLYLKLTKDSFDILKDLKIRDVLEPSFSLQTPSEFCMYNFDSVIEVIYPTFSFNEYLICLKNINKDYIKSIISNIRSFKQLIEDYDRGIMKDKEVLFHKEKFIENFKTDIDNFLKCNSLDWLYQTSLITDEDFFFIAMFYDNINYVPDILKEDFREIYWR